MGKMWGGEDQKAFPQEKIHHIDSFQDRKENRYDFVTPG